MWVPTISIALWTGYEVVTLIVKNKLPYLTRVFTGIPLGILYQSLLAFILQLYIPWSMKLNLIVNGIFIFIALSCHAIYSKKCRINYSIRMSILDAFTLLIAGAWLLSRMNYIQIANGQTGGACYSDFSFHFNIISSFAVGMNQKRKTLFDINMPIASGYKLAYPVLPNFYASFLIATTNCNYLSAFRAPTLLIGMSWLYLLHNLALTFTGSSLAATLALPLWAFSGGLGFLEVFDDGLEVDLEKPNHIHEWKRVKNVFWFQSMSHIFNPQRSATYVLPLCAITMCALINGVRKFEWQYFVLAALAVGITPQTQVHAYASLAFFSMSLAVTTFSFNGFFRRVLCWTIFGILANAIAFPLCIPFFIRTVTNTQFITVNPLWKDPKFGSGGFFHIFWNALGITAGIALFAGFATANAFQIRVYLATIPVLVISSFIMFQPWELDNTKLLHDAWYPLAVAFVGQYFATLFQKYKSKILYLTLAVMYTSCLISGFVNLYTYESFVVDFFRGSSKAMGLWAAENTPVESITHYYVHVLSPVSSFAGRILWMGYPGWTTSHGIENSTRTSQFTQLDSGKHQELYYENNISYIEVSRESKVSEYNEKYLENVFELGDRKLYKVITMPTPKPTPVVNITKTKPKRKKAKRTFNF